LTLKYDVVVVGAGPAGSTAAKHAADKGSKVLLIERKNEVGVPSHCAGFLMRRAENYVKLNDDMVADKIYGFKCYGPDGNNVVARSRDYIGYTIRREALDRYLANQAINSGVDLMIGATAVGARRVSGKVKVNTTHLNEKISVDAKIIIGADGVESNVAKWFGLEKPSDLTPCAQFDAVTKSPEVSRDLIEMYIGHQWTPKGFGWIFPRGNDIVKVGVGVKDGKKPVVSYLKDLINLHPVVSKKFVQAKFVRLSGGTVPLSGPVERTVDNNVILTGTAAGLINPVSGGGNDYAIICGGLAGDTAGEAAEKSDFSRRFLCRYENDWKSIFGKELRYGYFGRMVLQNMPDRLYRKFISTLQGEEGIAEMLVNYDVERLLHLVAEKSPMLSSFIKGARRFSRLLT